MLRQSHKETFFRLIYIDIYVRPKLHSRKILTPHLFVHDVSFSIWTSLNRFAKIIDATVLQAGPGGDLRFQSSATERHRRGLSEISCRDLPILLPSHNLFTDFLNLLLTIFLLIPSYSFTYVFTVCPHGFPLSRWLSQTQRSSTSWRRWTSDRLVVSGVTQILHTLRMCFPEGSQHTKLDVSSPQSLSSTYLLIFTHLFLYLPYLYELFFLLSFLAVVTAVATPSRFRQLRAAGQERLGPRDE